MAFLPFVGEIMIFSGNFAPNGWAMCNGQLMPISQNTALFSLLGTQYGGDGKSTFALPNLEGSAPLHFSHGPGLSQRSVGESGGEPAVTLIQSEMPAHAHGTLQCSNAPATQLDPANGIWGVTGTRRGTVNAYAWTQTNGQALMSPVALSPAGGNQPHNNMPPYLTLNFIIALTGIFPARS